MDFILLEIYFKMKIESASLVSKGFLFLEMNKELFHSKCNFGKGTVYKDKNIFSSNFRNLEFIIIKCISKLFEALEIKKYLM